MHKYKRLLLVALFLLVLLVAFQLSGLREHFTVQTLRDVLLENKLGGVLLFALLFTIGNLLQIPGWLFLGAAVLTLGRVWGGLATYVAAVFSCSCIFYIIRLLGGDALREFDNRLARRIFSYLDRHPVSSVTLLRLLFQTAPPLSYALSLSGVRFRHYLIGTLLGLPIPIALYCLLFDYLGKTLLHN